jgi:hypothetical protein
MNQIDLTATIAGQSYNLNGPNMRLQPYDLGMPAQRRLWQRSPSQNGRTELGGLWEPRFLDLSWKLIGLTLENFWDLRQEIQEVFVFRGAEPVVLTFQLAGGLTRSLDVFLDGELSWGRKHTNTTVSGVFVAPDWRLYEPTPYTVTYDTGGGGGLPIPFTIPVPIGASSLRAATGTIPYANGSRLAAPEFPVIVLTGPMRNPVIQNTTTGERIALTDNGGLMLGAGEFVTVDLSGLPRRDSKTIRNQNGEDISQYLTTDSDFNTFHLAPAGERLFNGTIATGDNTIIVTADGLTALSSVSLRYYNRYAGV